MSGGAAAQCLPVDKFHESPPERYRYFGQSVAVAGDWAIVGSGQFSSHGDAHVHRWDGAEWRVTQTLIGDRGYVVDSFADDLAMEGNVAVVGDHEDNTVDFSSGAVYVYRLEGDAFAREAKLIPADARRDTKFGYAVSLSGNVLAAGAPLDENCCGVRGSVYIYRHDGAQWNQEAKLRASFSQNLSYYGYGVAAHGDLVVVGDYGEPTERVYVYRHDGDVWNEEAVLTPFDGLNNVSFGWSVAVEDDVIAVGATNDDDGDANAGAIYVYRHDGDSWNGEAKLIGSNARSNGFLGFSLDMQGNRVVAGANEGFGSRGEAHVFRFEDGRWSEQVKFIPVPNRRETRFAADLAIDGAHVLVGDTIDKDEGRVSGAVYDFDATCESTLCDRVTQFDVSCRDGQLTVKVKSDLPEGTQLVIDRNGESHVLTLNDKGKGKLKVKRLGGNQRVTIVECPSFTETVNCD